MSEAQAADRGLLTPRSSHVSAVAVAADAVGDGNGCSFGNARRANAVDMKDLVGNRLEIDSDWPCQPRPAYVKWVPVLAMPAQPG